jgi:hypothetical protein
MHTVGAVGRGEVVWLGCNGTTTPFALRDCGDITVHGFRSTFRDWAAERSNFPSDVVERLAHGWGTRLRPHVVVAAYSISEAARHAAGHREESFRYRAGG